MMGTTVANDMQHYISMQCNLPPQSTPQETKEGNDMMQSATGVSNQDDGPLQNIRDRRKRRNGVEKTIKKTHGVHWPIFIQKIGIISGRVDSPSY